DYESAIAQFELIESIYGKDPEFLFGASEAYTRRARQLSDLLSAMDDSSARRHQHLAHRHLVRGDHPNALAELNLAIQCNPKLPGPREDKAEILWNQGEHSEAAALFQAELKINADAFLSNLRYGQFLLEQRKPVEAIPRLLVAVRHRRYPEAHQLLAYSYEQL